MNKTELVEAVAKKAGITKDAAAKAVNAFTDTVAEALKVNDKVVIAGFGTFETRKRAERTANNPSTHEPMTIPASTVPAFKAGKALKDSVK